MASLIESIELISGDSSDIWEFSSPDFTGFDTDPEWEGNWSIRNESVSGTEVLTGVLVKSEDTFTFLLTPIESASLEPGSYFLTIEIKNLTLNFRRELVQCKLKITVSGYDNA